MTNENENPYFTNSHPQVANLEVNISQGITLRNGILLGAGLTIGKALVTAIAKQAMPRVEDLNAKLTPKVKQAADDVGPRVKEAAEALKGEQTPGS